MKPEVVQHANAAAFVADIHLAAEVQDQLVMSSRASQKVAEASGPAAPVH